jgi:hypothetical protein
MHPSALSSRGRSPRGPESLAGYLHATSCLLLVDAVNNTRSETWAWCAATAAAATHQTGSTAEITYIYSIGLQLLICSICHHRPALLQSVAAVAANPHCSCCTSSPYAVSYAEGQQPGAAGQRAAGRRSSLDPTWATGWPHPPPTPSPAPLVQAPFPHPVVSHFLYCLGDTAHCTPDAWK